MNWNVHNSWSLSSLMQTLNNMQLIYLVFLWYYMRVYLCVRACMCVSSLDVCRTCLVDQAGVDVYVVELQIVCACWGNIWVSSYPVNDIVISAREWSYCYFHTRQVSPQLHRLPPSIAFTSCICKIVERITDFFLHLESTKLVTLIQCGFVS